VLKSAPGWSSDKATESEADVKADREPLPKNVRELQKETVEIIVESEGFSVHGGGSKVKEAAEKLGQRFEKLEDRLEKNIEEKGEKAVEKLARRAEAAGTTLGTATGTIKGKADRAEDAVVHEVKSGAEKVSSFVKGVKKTVGLGSAASEENIKKRAKGVDDHVDGDRGA
jgi:molecular chaperone GrpE (heat shock protein)